MIPVKEKTTVRGDFIKIIDRLKGLRGLKSDTAIAEMLGMGQSTFAERKRRNSIPYGEIINFCDKEGLSLDWLLAGEGPQYREEKKEITACHETPRLVDLIKKLEHIYKEGELKERVAVRGIIEEVYDEVKKGRETKGGSP
ncbi:MAG: helix-turn-helix domain-containing protein [Deltaproteobacteria bacterium]|nr:helix-turn-helix domain-containing protein [Deltaproteobacteria bacterium]